MFNHYNNFEYLNTLNGDQGKIIFVAFCLDERTLVSGSRTKIKLWNSETGQEICTLINAGEALPISSICLSTDRQTLVCENCKGIIKAWNLQTGQQFHPFRAHSSPIKALAVSSNGQTLASSSYDGTTKIWELKKGREIKLWVASSNENSLVFSLDSQLLAYGSSCFVKVIHWKTNEEISSFDEHLDAVHPIAISTDGQVLVSGGWDNTVIVWNLATGEAIHTLEGHSNFVSSIVISLNSQILVSGSYDKTIKIWNLVTGQEVCTFIGHTDNITSIAITTDGQKIVSGSWDETIKVWKVA